MWTFRSLGKNLTDTVVTRRQHTLVFHGPYRWIRHPFYDSAGLVATGVSVIVANWFLFAERCCGFCLFMVRTRIEKRTSSRALGTAIEGI